MRKISDERFSNFDISLPPTGPIALYARIPKRPVSLAGNNVTQPRETDWEMHRADYCTSTITRFMLYADALYARKIGSMN